MTDPQFDLSAALFADLEALDLRGVDIIGDRDLACDHYFTQPSDYGDFKSPGSCVECWPDEWPCKPVRDVMERCRLLLDEPDPRD